MKILGIDIGGTNIKLAVFDRNGNMYNRERIATSEFLSFDQFADYLDFFIKKIKFKIKGIGIGAPNGNSISGQIEFAPNLKWGKNIEVVRILSQKTGLPVKLINDANAIALAELKFGHGREYNNFLVITLGTGLGSGIIVNGKLLQGANGLAGELGHITLIPGGRKCSCGRLGCLEEYVSARGIQQTYFQLTRNNISVEKIATFAKNNENAALLTFEMTAKYLGLGLANFIHLFDSDAVIFYGGIANSYYLWADKTYEILNENLMSAFKNKVKFKLSALQEVEGAALGAATLFF